MKIKKINNIKLNDEGNIELEADLSNNYILKIDNIRSETMQINVDYVSIKDYKNITLGKIKDSMSITFDIMPNKDNNFYTIVNTNKYHVGDYVYNIKDKEPFKIIYIRYSTSEVLSYQLEYLGTNKYFPKHIFTSEELLDKDYIILNKMEE